MDAYLELFQTKTAYQRITVPGGQTEGYVDAPDMDEDLDPLDSAIGRGSDLAYAVEYLQEEERALESGGMVVDEPHAGPSGGHLMEMEELSSIGTHQQVEMDLEQQQQLTTVYKTYNFDAKPAIHLPIYNCRDKIIRMVHTYNTVIIDGHTGCGKTTQVPQFILDQNRDAGRHCNIIVTQPRRIAAISIAARVASERGWPLGSLVGYKIGLNEKLSEDTRLLYCTTGVLLQTIIADKNLSRYTHIILDEVHERDQEMDFLLLLVRKMQRTNSRNCKIVLMSATIDCEKFSQYFASNFFSKVQRAPIIPIGSSEQCNFNVVTYYLHDIKDLGVALDTNSDDPFVTQSHHRLTALLIKRFDMMEEVEQSHDERVRGSVLVFLPGIMEIEDLYNLLSKDKNQYRWTIMPLHSSVTREEQSSVFRILEPSGRKIILATNIAESSITVPDIKYVIDYCMTKQLVTDPSTNFTTLQLTWAANANCDQRKGRAGRVSSGRVYRLVTKEQYDNFLEEQEPEMRRCPLSRLILMCKLLDTGEPKSLLALALDPPDLQNISKTILILKEAGGLLMTSNNRASKDDGDITFLGRIMARLPLDIHVSKMIALGHIFGVLEDCVIMGAAMSVKNMFASPFQERLEAYQSKLAWSASSSSDPIAFRNAFKVWKMRAEQGYFERTRQSSEGSWAQRYFIQVRALREVNDLVIEIQRRMKRLGFDDFRGPNQVAWSDVEEPLVLKLVLAGAFYPNYFVRGSQGGQVDEKDAVRQLVGRDPYSTIYLQGMPQNHPKEIYTKNIKQMLSKLAPRMKVTFDDTKKVYVEFPRQEVARSNEGQPAVQLPGKVSLTVYRAVKMRQLGIPFRLNILSEHQAMARFEKMSQPPLVALSGSGSERLRQHYHMNDLRDRWRTDSVASSSSYSQESYSQPQPSFDKTHLPPLTKTCIQITITHIENAGRFWAHDMSIAQGNLEKMHHYLNSSQSDLVQLRDWPRIGQLVVAPYHDPNKAYYRARVLELSKQDSRSAWVKVQFVDYGNTDKLPISEVFDFGDRLRGAGVDTEPGYAMECTMAKVQPSLVRSCGQWSQDANKHFQECTGDGSLFAYVFSVVNSVVSLIIYKNQIVDRDGVMKNSLNQEMIKKYFAQEAQESYLSKCNREARDQADNCLLNTAQIIVYEEQQHSQIGTDPDNDPAPPHRSETTTTVDLKGPYSPLEMKVFHLIRGGTSKLVNIDPNSVNSVLIDDDPQDCHERLLVAASVQASQDGARLTLRQTSILPSLPGLPAILCLLFAPQVELRVDPKQERITGGLFGLGCDENNRAYFPQHDMEVTFDTKIELTDIQQINRLRFWINVALHTEVGDTQPTNCSNDVVQYQQKVKKCLHELLSRKREYQNPSQSCKPFKWGQLPEDSLRAPGDCKLGGREVFPMHWGVSLEPEGTADRRKLVDNGRELLTICETKQWTSAVRCLMCKTTLQSLMALMLHVHSTDHIHREFALNKKKWGNLGGSDSDNEDEQLEGF